MMEIFEIYTFKKAKCFFYQVYRMFAQLHGNDSDRIRKEIRLTIQSGSLTRSVSSSKGRDQRTHMVRTPYTRQTAVDAKLDRLRWYCRSQSHTEPTIIREEVFHVTDLG